MKKCLRHLRSDGGDTLVEILVTVVIMGIAVAAIVGGVATSIFMATTHRQQASEQTLLRGYADAVAANQTWKGCSATPSDYAPSAPGVGFNIPASYGTGYSASATAVKFPNAGAFTSTSCATDPGILQVSIQIQSTRATERMDVVARCLGKRTAAGGPCP